MKLEMTTNFLGLVEPGLYGTELGYLLCDVEEEYTSDFKNQLCFEATNIMNEIFSEDWFVDKFGNYVVSNATLHSPRFYNYENDRLDFDLEIDNPKRIIEDYYGKFEAWDIEEFFKWTEKNYGSYSGFVSFFPYTYKEFEIALSSKPNTNFKYERAIAMLIMFALHKGKCALDSYQNDLEENMAEFCFGNGLCYIEED